MDKRSEIRKKIEELKAVAFAGDDDSVSRSAVMARKIADDRISDLEGNAAKVAKKSEEIEDFWDAYHAIILFAEHLESHAVKMDEGSSCSVLDLTVSMVNEISDRIIVAKVFNDLHMRIMDSGAGTAVVVHADIEEGIIGDGLMVVLIVDHDGDLYIFGQRTKKISATAKRVLDRLQGGDHNGAVGIETGDWSVAIEMEGFCPPATSRSAYRVAHVGNDGNTKFNA